ncbi:hypothetical protein [Aliivibrio logei]|uniref:hypothetical protein n=1 Tax=Aliivibrio logei TaxID=688 RepID=UPI0003A192B6|nr:hypothetical protein [Aliivibrio logei]
MRLLGWPYWHRIINSKKGRSLERWTLRHLHWKVFLTYLARKIVRYNKNNNIFSSVEVSSIWIDGTPQAHGIARNNKVKCELADLLYIVEESDPAGNVLSKKALLLQGKNTPKFNKIDNGSSTRKERALFEKLDRFKELTLKVGVQNSSRIIGTYILGGAIKEGLSDCAKFLLMPKNKFWVNRSAYYFPFHVTWTKNENTSEMKQGLNLIDAAIEMSQNGKIGKAVIDPSICEWSRLVTDLENNYNYVNMNGYGGQNRIYRSKVQLMSSIDRFSDDPKLLSSSRYVNEQLDNLPYISIVKVAIVYDRFD